MSKIGFIGLGTMGGPMAANLVKGGHCVKGFDIRSDFIKRHTDSGGLEANNCADAAKETEFLFTMLPTHQHLETAIFGEHGAYETLTKQTILIDMSTVNPFESDKI